MRKLTKEQRKALEWIFEELKAARDFIQDPEILICRKKSAATTTLDFKNSSGEAITPIEKESGSMFARFYSGLTRLETFLNQ